MKKFLLLLLVCVGMAAQTQTNPYWLTIGKGLKANKPSTCKTQKDVYICSDCNGGLGSVLYCDPMGTSANTWFYLNFSSSDSGGGGGTHTWATLTQSWASSTTAWSAI